MSEQDCMLETATSEYKSLDVAINPHCTKATSDIESMCNKAELVMSIHLQPRGKYRSASDKNLQIC